MLGRSSRLTGRFRAGTDEKAHLTSIDAFHRADRDRPRIRMGWGRQRQGRTAEAEFLRQALPRMRRANEGGHVPRSPWVPRA